jgi:hypothetical protein
MQITIKRSVVLKISFGSRGAFPRKDRPASKKKLTASSREKPISAAKNIRMPLAFHFSISCSKANVLEMSKDPLIDF